MPSPSPRCRSCCRRWRSGDADRSSPCAVSSVDDRLQVRLRLMAPRLARVPVKLAWSAMLVRAVAPRVPQAHISAAPRPSRFPTSRPCCWRRVATRKGFTVTPKFCGPRRPVSARWPKASPTGKPQGSGCLRWPSIMISARSRLSNFSRMSRCKPPPRRRLTALTSLSQAGRAEAPRQSSGYRGRKEGSSPCKLRRGGHASPRQRGPSTLPKLPASHAVGRHPHARRHSPLTCMAISRLIGATRQ
jgi:hypothetical protein